MTTMDRPKSMADAAPELGMSLDQFRKWVTSHPAADALIPRVNGLRVLQTADIEIIRRTIQAERANRPARGRRPRTG